MSADQKERYKQQAKTKPARTIYVPAKFTSQGIPLEQVEREQQALAEKKRYMERKIKNMIENAFLDNGAYMLRVILYLSAKNIVVVAFPSIKYYGDFTNIYVILYII